MDAAVGLSKSEHCWRGFKRGNWCNTIDVRDFIVLNATPQKSSAAGRPESTPVGSQNVPGILITNKGLPLLR